VHGPGGHHHWVRCTHRHVPAREIRRTASWRKSEIWQLQGWYYFAHPV